MTWVFRIEIVIDALHREQAIELLRAGGRDSYTLIRGVSRANGRGLQSDGRPAGAWDDDYLLTTCLPEELDALVEDLGPLLSKAGGLCLVSEARWLAC
ncbi:MAG: transcriptional regulator [Acidobacteriota bacterium]